MAARSLDILRGLKVLVVEDEPLIAMALSDELEACGAIVIGPAPTIEIAIAAIRENELAAAVLDVELQGRMVTQVAELLALLKIPHILTTGHDDEALPPEFRDLARCMKPATAEHVLETLCANLSASRG